MRQDAVDNREAIVAAARTLFVEHGGNVYMRAIAKEAGVGIATVSRHFPDRLTLIDAIGAHAVHNIETVVSDHLALFDSNPEKAWRDAVHAIADIKLALLGQALLSEATQLRTPGTDIHHLVTGRAGEISGVYEKLLTPAKVAGLCPHHLAPLDFHVALAIASRPLPNVESINPQSEQIQQGLIDVLLDGLHAQARQATT